MPPTPPRATAADVAALDDVASRIGRVAAVLEETGSALGAALAASPWRGRAAEAASDRTTASRRALLAGLPLAAAASLAVARLRASVATEAAALAAVERVVRDALTHLGGVPVGLPDGLLDRLRRAASLGGWTGGATLGGIPLPLPGARAWREAGRVLGGLLP